MTSPARSHDSTPPRPKAQAVRSRSARWMLIGAVAVGLGAAVWALNGDDRGDPERPCTGDASCRSPADRCALDVCHPSTKRCVARTVVCADGDPCSLDRCDAATGACFYPSTCDDNNPCTWDGCDKETGACHRAPRKCDDGALCTRDSCDPRVGCRHAIDPACRGCLVAAQCDDGEPCTVDTCAPGTATCHHHRRPSCAPAAADAPGAECRSDNDCRDDDACSIGGCTYGRCVRSRRQCPSLIDTVERRCDPQRGCTIRNHVVLPACATAADCAGQAPCMESVACVHNQCLGLAKHCDDGDPCTFDRCLAATGACEHLPRKACDWHGCPLPYAAHVCSDGDTCLAYRCVPVSIAGRIGTCVAFAQSRCDDGDPCTRDRCISAEKCAFERVPGCRGCVANADCDDDNPCTVDACLNEVGVCSHDGDPTCGGRRGPE